MKMKNITTIAIISLLVIGIFAGAAAALDKEEVVYVNLSPSGDVKDVNVVNIFEPTEPMHIVDYGEYKSVKNLVTTETIVQTGDENVVHVDGGRFFYQGNMGATEIPWDINISYFLDGHYIKPDQIAGKSGHVMIVLDICKNEKFPDTYFYKNLGIQATVLLNATDCWNIDAPGAVIANNGKNKQLSYTIMPNKGGVFNISFDTTNFEMQSINLNGLILTMDVDVDLTDAKSMMRTLGSATSALESGAETVDTIAGVLKAGTSGISVYEDGIGEGESHVNSMVDVWIDFINNNYYGVVLGKKIEKDETCILPSSYVDMDGKIITEGHEFYNLVEYLRNGCVLTKSLKTLEKGASGLAAGTSSLASGASKLASSTSGLDNKIESMVDKILEQITGKNKYLRSFTSVKNVDIKSIQFAMHTDAIEIPEEVVVEETVKELSFWDRILKLFGLYKEE